MRRTGLCLRCRFRYLEEKMNIAALASWFAPEKTAGHSPAKPARPDSPPQSAAASTVVTLSAANTTPQTGKLTYGAPPSLLDQPLLLPTRENVAKLAQEATDSLNAMLDAAGIPRKPGFELEIEDVNSAHVTVKSDRPDAQAIEDLINADQQLQMTLHNAEAIASHIPAIERSMAYQEEYRAARTQQQIDQVNARYADLLSGHSTAADIGMRYGETGIEVTIDREVVRG